MSKVNLSNLTNLQSEVAAVTTINNNNTLITQAIENTISRDGTLPNAMNSNLDMNSNKIINLPDAYTDQEPVTYGQYVAGITAVNSGVVVDGAYILAEHDDTTINDRVLVAGSNLQVTDGGAKGNFTVSVSDAELNAIADVVSAADKVPYFTGSGTADVADFTSYARTLVDDVDAETARATLGLVIDTDVQPHDPTLNSLVSAGNGIMTKTAANTITPRTITAPANGISITDGDGVAGNPTLALTNDLAAIEGLATTGIIARTATDTAATRTVTGTANEITVVNGDGVAGDPTVSIPNSVTFTGKTVTGGTFSSPTINTPSGITKSDVGLSNVDNTSDATKNAAIATLTNKTLTSPVINSPTGIVKGDVGLGNVDNTSDATKNAASATLTNKTISGSSNTLSNIANASLSTAADSTIKSNISGSAASPSDNTITAVLDKQFGTTQGTIAYRGATSWDALTPGTTGYFLQTQGSAANPTWTSVPGGGDLLSTNNLSDVSNFDTSRTNLKSLGGGLKTQVFTSSGTFTTPSTSRTDTVYRYKILGAGGGGGGTNASTATGGGGGAGAYAEGTFTGVAASTAITVTVGTAGSGGSTSGGNGGTGGSSSLGSPVSITCAGGVGGNGSTTTVGLGGAGGTVTGTPDIIGFTGQSGTCGIQINNGSGVTNIIAGGFGGDSPFGFSGRPGQAIIAGTARAPASGYGAGGAGGLSTGALGSAGSAGIIIIEWFES